MGNTPDDTGKPLYDDNSEPQADLQAAVEYAEKVGGLLKVTAAERGSLTGSQTKVGWLIVETDTNRVYLRTASEPQGRLLAYDTGDVDLTLQANWSDSAQDSTYRVRNGVASLNGRLAAASGAGTTAFQLPAEARPSSTRTTSVMTGTNVFETVIIQAGGNVIFFNLTTPAGDYRLASIPPWPVG